MYLSCDPYLRIFMKKVEGNHSFSFIPRSPIIGCGVSRVVDSSRRWFEKGDLVWGITIWEEYSLIKSPRILLQFHDTDVPHLLVPGAFCKIRDTDVPLSYYAGLLGMPGMIAYAGFAKTCFSPPPPGKGETIFISEASEAIGQLVGQLAKLMGCYVFGSTASKDKVSVLGLTYQIRCSWEKHYSKNWGVSLLLGSDISLVFVKVDPLKKKLECDNAFSHQEELDFDAALKRYFPNDIDIYFDNMGMGGEMLETVVLNMRLHGRIAACAMTTHYDFEQDEGVQNLFSLIAKLFYVHEFGVGYCYYDLYPKFLEMVLPLIKEGRITYLEDIAESLEKAPGALVGVFCGRNVGKQVVAVAHE